MRKGPGSPDNQGAVAADDAGSADAVCLEDRELYVKLGGLARFVDDMMKTLCELERPLTNSADHLPRASAALTELVKMTEEGTHKVMELTEQLLDSQMSPEAEQKLIEIMTALSFQDLVGQRVKKVVSILDEVQTRLLELVVAFGRKPEGTAGHTAAVALLNELDQAPATAIKQHAVDDVLKEYGF